MKNSELTKLLEVCFEGLTNEDEIFPFACNYDSGFIYVLVNNTPYAVRLMGGNQINRISVFEKTSIDISTTIFDNNPVHTLLQAQYTKGLHDYLTKVIEKNNASYLADNLKNYIFDNNHLFFNGVKEC